MQKEEKNRRNGRSPSSPFSIPLFLAFFWPEPAHFPSASFFFPARRHHLYAPLRHFRRHRSHHATGSSYKAPAPVAPSPNPSPIPTAAASLLFLPSLLCFSLSFPRPLPKIARGARRRHHGSCHAGLARRSAAMTTSSTRAEPEQNDHTRACFPFVLYFLSGHRHLPRHLHTTVIVPFANLLSPTRLGEPLPPGTFLSFSLLLWASPSCALPSCAS